MERKSFEHAGLTLSYLDAGGGGEPLIALHALWMEAGNGAHANVPGMTTPLGLAPRAVAILTPLRNGVTAIGRNAELPHGSARTGPRPTRRLRAPS